MRNKLIFLLLVWLIGFVFILVFRRLTQPFISFIYWAILGLFISTVWIFKIKSQVVLFSAFGLFILGGIIAAFKLNSIAEIILRISLIGWLVGFIKSLVEYFFKKILIEQEA